MRTSRSIGILCTTLLSASTGVYAQSAKPDMEEVIVRAQKGAKADTVQTVPIAVTAVSAQTIENIQAVNIVDVSRVVPNANFTSASTLPGFANFIIRGLGVNGSTGTIAPSVNVVVDGMVYDFQGGTVLDAFGLESVEILRGPQGALFGRNTTGGAVSVRTARPSHEFGASAEVTVGDYNRLDTAASVTGSLVPDVLAGKFTILKRTRDGYSDDKNGGTFVPAPLNPSGLQPDTERGTVGDVDTLVLRPSLLWEVTEGLDVSILTEYARLKGGGAYAHPLPEYDTPLQTRFGYTPPSGDWEINTTQLGFQDTDAKRIVAEVNWDVGPGIITSITGYRDVDYQYGFDTDGTPFLIAQYPRGNEINSEQTSEELRFASTFSETFDFVVGGYYDKFDIESVEHRLQSNLVGNPNAATYTVSALQGLYDQKTESSALFGSINYHPAPEWTLTAGGRKSYEKKELNIVPLGACATLDFTGCSTTSGDFKKTWKDFSPKLGVQYQISDDVMAYASWTKGFRSGNYNGRATSFAQVGPADPEKATSTEIGLKSTFWDNRARVNITGFYTEFDDMQQTVLLGPLQVLQNAASAKIKGVEIESTVKPIESIELTANFGYTDAQFDEVTPQFASVLRRNGVLLTHSQIMDLKFIKVPDYTAYVAGTYFFHLPWTDVDFSARASYAWHSEFYVDVVNSEFARQKSVGTVDVNLVGEIDQWRVTVFGKNLTDERQLDLAASQFIPVQYGGEPRTFGVTLNYRY